MTPWLISLGKRSFFLHVQCRYSADKFDCIYDP
jgi:hypothetical protein